MRAIDLCDKHESLCAPQVRGLDPEVEQGRRYLHLPHGSCSHTLAGALVPGYH